MTGVAIVCYNTPKIITKMEYDVTVLVNSYNEKEPVFRRAIESIVKAKPIQIIISTVKGDQCIKWAENYPAQVIINEKPGIFQQLNAMIPYIKGKYVCYASSNDKMLPNKLKIEVSKLKGKNKVCYSSFKVINKLHNRVYIQKFPTIFNYQRMFKSGYISDCSMVETKTFLKYMPFREQYNNSAYRDLWLRIYEGEGNVFVYNDMPAWVYYIDVNSQHVRQKKDPEIRKKRMADRERMLNDHR